MVATAMLTKSSVLPQTVQTPGTQQLGHMVMTQVKGSKSMAQGHSKKHQAVREVQKGSDCKEALLSTGTNQAREVLVQLL